MGEVINVLSNAINNFYTYFLSLLPDWAQKFFGLFLLILAILVYSIFVWKLGNFISKKNILELNLRQYNNSQHPVLSKILSVVFYVLEYIIIMPVVTFFWFAVFTIFLLFMSEGIPTTTVLIISATIVSVIRMTSYYNQNLSKSLALLLPFNFLAISMVRSGFFDFERVVSQISQLPQLFNNIIAYLIFIIALETILRFFEFIFSLFGIGDDADLETEDE